MKHKPNNLLSSIFVIIQFTSIAVIVLNSSLGWIPSYVVFYIGLFIGLWAIYTMKFSVNIFPNVLKKQKLFLSGPYRFIRHPMYLSVLMVTGGFVINNPNMITIIVWGILLINLIYKLKYEEGLLVSRFPEYSKYMEKTKRLIPGIF